MIDYFMFACVFATLAPDPRPLAVEANYFPLDLVENCRGIGLNYKYHLEQRRMLYHTMDERGSDLDEAIRETKYMIECWDTLWNIKQCTTVWMNDYKRDQLSKLRDQLGPEAFYAHQMCPPVPIWRFREIEW